MKTAEILNDFKTAFLLYICQ